VLLDITGALLLNTLFFAVLAHRRRNLRQDLTNLLAMRVVPTGAYPDRLAASP
jgi:hypothetical protein